MLAYCGVSAQPAKIIISLVISSNGLQNVCRNVSFHLFDEVVFSFGRKWTNIFFVNLCNALKMEKLICGKYSQKSLNFLQKKLSFRYFFVSLQSQF